MRISIAIKKSVFLLYILAVFVPMLISCNIGHPNGANNIDRSPSDAVYVSLIDLLENEIKQLKDDNKRYGEEYDARIAELEKLIDNAKENDGDGPDAQIDPKDGTPFTYRLDGENAVLTEYEGEYSVLVIPETVDGHPVTEIADSLFFGNKKLTSVSVPKTVTKIGWFAFSGCVSLKTVNITESVKNIGYDAFAYCPGLTLYCPKGSYTADYAESFGLTVVTK